MDQHDVLRVLRSVLSDVLLLDELAPPETPLGGGEMNSLVAARLWLEIQDRLGVDVPLAWLSGALTLSELAGRITGEAPAAAARPSVALRPDPAARLEPFPLTPMQESYLTGTYLELTPDPVGCHQYLELEIDDLDHQRLASAWRRLVDHHDMLRAVVTADGRQQVRDEAGEWTMPVHDLTGAPPDEVESFVAGVRARLSHRSPAPGSWPGFALELCLRPGGSGLVHLSLDGLFVDGHGIALLLAQWADLYRAPEARLPTPDVSARDCVLAMAARHGGGDYERDLAFWLDRLCGAPPGPSLGPPAGGEPARDGGPAGGFTRRALSGRLEVAEWSALRERAAAWGVSPSSLVLTVLADALARGGARPPFSLVVTTSARSWLPADAAGVVGPFTSSAVVVAEVPAGEPLQAAATALHRQVWEALDHASVSGVDALRELRARGQAAPDALPVVFTSMLGLGPQGHTDAGFGANATYALSQTSGVLLDCQIWEQGDELHVRWDTATGQFPVGAAETAFARFLNGLHGACLPEQPATRRLNALQQAYFVARSAGGDQPWDGCQIYESFQVPGLDPARLSSALLRMVEAYDAMRSWVDGDGVVRTLARAPAGWQVPVIDLGGLVDPSTVLGALRDELAGRVFPLGRWPGFEVRATVGAGPPTLHWAFDIALFDAPSVHFLCRELLRLHADPRAAPRPAAPLPARAPQPGEGRDDPARAHWEERAASLPPGPLLPAGSAPPDGHGAGRRVRLEGRLPGWRRLRQEAARRGVSADALLLAAYTRVLAEDLEQPDFAVSVVRWDQDDERHRPAELTRLSWVPAAAAGASPLEAAGAIARQIAEDVRADAVEGLEVVRRQLMRRQARGGEAYPVVYSSVIDLSGWPLPAGTSPGPWLSCTPDVTLDCIGTADGDELRYCWDAVAGRFAPGWLAAAFARYGQLLQALTSGTEAPRVHAGPLSRAEYRTVVHAWNATEHDFPEQRLAHELFEDRAAERPGAIAVRGRAGQATYGELNAHANRIAWRLEELGAGPGTVVAVAARRGPAMIAAVLGALKSGAAYVPVEPGLPRERALRMLERIGARVVLTTSDTVRWAPPDGATVVEVDRNLGPGGGRDGAAGDPHRRARPDDIAYVIFTSGSTGAPKGVAVTHRTVSNLLNWCRRRFGFGAGDVGLAVTSLGFDLSVFDVFGLLGFGGSLYVADEEQQKDPALLLEVLLREPVTFWNSAPTTLAQLAPLLPGAAGDPGARSLRLVFLSGDYTPLSLPGDLRAAFPHASVVSLGGATEATVWSNWFPVGEVDPSWRSVPYGTPIDNARYYVLDEGLQPCPVGVEGDLYIAGDCLSQGYYGEPALTADRFVPDPFSTRPGQRMYRTGDRAAYDPDGTIRFLGRVDHQVKIRGFRVELGEIEHRLRQHPGVKEVVVLARPDGAGDRKLVAHVLPDGAPPSAGELRRHAAETLPDYMVPNFVSVVSTFPTTANGKLDREALPWPLDAPAAAPPEPTGGPDLDRLADEIAAVFAEVLGVTRVDQDQDIWDQGATSFTLVQVSNALQRRYGHRIPIGAVLADPTVAGIARHLHAALASSGTPPAAAPPPAEAAEAAPPAPEPAAGVEAGPPAVVDFFSAPEREAFKAAHWNLRPLAAPEDQLSLHPGDPVDALWLRRASRRDFLDAPARAASLGRLLGLLRSVVVDGAAHHLYPSAGDTYAVQVYLHVKAGRVDGIAPGAYYYRPTDHRLERVGDGAGIDRSLHFHYNRPLYDAAAFELYLVGQTRAVAPVYRENAERYLAVEAGHMSQLLMMAQAEFGLGLCPIGEVSFERLKPELGAGDGHRFLMSFLGGAATHRFSGPRLLGPEPGRQDPVAVVGMSGRYPGAAEPEALWRNLCAGVRSTGPAPPGRAALAAQGLPGGFLEAVDEFDSLLFHISPAEARTLDPQLRLLLQGVWECLEHAGHTPASLRGASPRVGVYVATMWHDYELVGAEAAGRTGLAEAGSTASDIPHRISHFFDFTGPSIAVDVSCSSSLAALHLAVESLRRGECDAAVVAAANLLAHPYHGDLLRSWGLASDSPAAGTGAFDADASGWIPGEGVGVLLLRPAPTAEADGDTVYALVEATWTGHWGHAGRFGVPVVEPLAEAISGGLARAGLRPADVDYVECAAGGASIADSAEIEALARVFGGERDRRVPVGTLKHNIGHLEAAAGLSQLTKVVLQLRHGLLAPTPLASDPNPLLPWRHLPVRVADRLEAWRGPTRRALVNAFGAAGSYGHAVLRSAPPAAEPADDRRPHAVPLSAATAEQLRACARRLRDHLDGTRGTLAEVAFTLQTGRAQLAHRLSIWCEGLADLRDGLDTYLEGRPHPRVQVGAERPPATTSAAGRVGEQDDRERDLLDAWLAGKDVDWGALWPRPARRVALPTYPFARESHWVAAAPAPPPAAGSGVLERLRQCYAQVSGIPVERLDPHAPLEHYGLNSALVVQLNAALERDFGALSRTLFFEHQTLAEIAAHLPPPAAAPVGAQAPAPPWRERRDEDVAIVGIAGRYPGAADLDQLWRLLEEGRDAITPLPEERRRPGWPAELMWGAFLDGVDRFDPLFFGIASRDADLMDPQERLFLEVVWEALEDAGYPRGRLLRAHGGSVGVFAATMYSEYPFFGVERSLSGKPVSTGSSVAGIANRVSYFLDLRGPSLTVDTMCSSSLTAVHLAVSSLRLGECQAAIAGAVNLSLHPNKFVEQARLKMTSSDHRCRAFGAGADGFAPGEGVGAVLLKPLGAAIAAGDRIHAVIKATAVNHGGKTNGYTVPNPVAQGELIASALARAGVPPQTIGYVEAHGTGTALGDPVEVNGLERGFGAAGLPRGSCPIGSVKSNLGHLEGAAGILGITKVVLQLRHRRLVPTLHAAELNPNVDWARSPFRPQREPADWPRPTLDGKPAPRRAGVSSFGAGGANAHVIIEEAPASPPGAHGTRPQLLVLSARDEGRLRELAAGLAARLEAAAEPACDVGGLEEIAWTLQVGREPLRERLAVVAGDHGELLAALRRFAASESAHLARGRAPAAGEARPEAPPTGVAATAGAPVAAGAPWALDREGLAALGRRWVRGETVDWASLHPDERPRLVSLPSYPFARHRHWLPEPVPALPLFTKTWRPAAAPPAVSAAPALVCLYAAASERAVRRLAEVAGGRVWLLREGAAGSEGFVDEASAVAAVRGLLQREPDLEGLVDLCDLGRGTGPGRWAARLAAVTELLARRRPLRVLLGVAGLQDLPGPPPDLAGARMAGFLRALDAEHGRLRATVVDTDGRPDEAVAHLLAEWAGDAGEVCWRAGRRHLPRLEPVQAAAEAPALDPEKTYLVTGGTGGLGAEVARHLCRRGARRLALLGRRPVRPRAEWDRPDLSGHEASVVARVRELEALGARVALYTGALTDRARLGAFLADVRALLGEIGGVVHCAGTMPAVGPFSGADAEQLRAVLEPKVEGLLVLEELCAADRPRFFVSFSSLAASVPRLAAGVVRYAAANAFMDFHAIHRARSGRPWVRSIGWPGWRDAGMTQPIGVDVGVATLAVEEGLAILDAVIAGQLPATVLVAPPARPGLDPQSLLAPRTAALLPSGPRPTPAPAAPPATPSGPDPAPTPAPVAPAAAPGGPAAVPAWLVEVFSGTLGTAPDELDPTAPFGELGVESVLLGELVTRIEGRIGGHVEPSSLLDHPTLERLAAYLAGRAPLDPPSEPEPAQRPADPPPVPSDPAPVPVATARRPDADERRVAVIGLACRFPGAPDAAAFWRNLRAGHCAIGEVPPARWDTAALYRPVPEVGKSISRWGGFVDGIEDFDPEWFGMTEEEATCLDPAIRLVLEGAVTCLRDAGYADEEVAGTDVGVFMGARLSSYGRRAGVRAGSAGFGADQNFVAARLAQQLDLTGPNLVVDSACSSALVAVQLAVRSLLDGESAMALAGGVDVLLDEQPYLEFSAVQALSPSGRCRAFDRGADGFVPGEGCGVLLLKRLDRALRDGDRVRAVIEAVAVGNDGRTMGLTTPNLAAQAAVVRRALWQSGRRADEIGMVEAHGTGTMIGDPIELRALTTVFREAADRSGFCAIGSVKSNVGHLLSAAGMAGLVKVVLALEHGKLPPTLFCEVPNPRFDFAASPFYPNTTLRAWPGPGPRVAGVSAFGLGGTNAHLIASAPYPARPGPARPPLPAPRFRRRRLWLERPDAPPAPAPGNGLVASLLALDFGDGRAAAGKEPS